MRRSLSLLASVVYLLAVGCTDSTNTDGSGVTQVVSIESDQDQIAVGEESVFYIDFDFDENEVYFEGGAVNLVVRLPAALSYLMYSAEVNEYGSADNSVDPYIVRCGNGSSYLVFSLDDNDLDEAYSPNDAEAQLKMTLVGRRPGYQVMVQATADDGLVQFGCEEEFVADESEAVIVY